MKKPRNTTPTALRTLFAASLGFAMTIGAQAAVIDLGPSFTPTGADYTIYAVQGIDASNPLGQSSFAPQVNQNFEFTGSTGVAYQNSTGTLTNFGLGLYAGTGGKIESTGLNVQYNSTVLASSVTIKVEDFDITTGATGFNLNKVAPSIALFGTGGSVIATVNPATIFPNLQTTGTNDVWNVNLGSLLTSLGQSDTGITGYLLYADANLGERPNSDPYLLVNAGNGVPSIPETSSFLPLLGVLGLVIGAGYLRRRSESESVTA